MRRTDTRSRERGTMLMELALIMPFLILIAMLVIEGSRVVRAHQILNNAAREGARLSILQDNNSASGVTAIQNAVVNYATQNHIAISATNVTVEQGLLIPVPGGVMPASRVTVSYPYTVNYLGIFAWLGVPSTYTLTGRAVFGNFYESTT